MRITEIHVADFGAWHDLSLRELEDGATVFFGPNEAGKTTLLNFVRTVLYGFSSSRCDRYLPPASGGEAGGWLQVSAVSGNFRIERTAAPNNREGTGRLRICAHDGSPQAADLLTTLLTGVDETIFNNVFAVGLTQMQQLATLSDTEAAAQLYGLATGTDRVSLFDVRRELETQRDSLLPSQSDNSDNDGQLGQLLEQRTRLQRELKTLRRDAGHWGTLRTEYAQLTRKIRQQEAARRRLEGDGDWNELSKSLRAQWSRCRQLNKELAEIGPLVDIPAAVAARVDELNQQVRRRRQQWEQMRRQRRDLKRRSQQLGGRDTLYRHAAEIEALDRQRTHIVALEADVTQWRTQVDELEFEMQAELEQLGLQAGASAKQFPQISDQVIEALREPARETRELRQHVDAAKKTAEDCRAQAKQLKHQLETASLRVGGEGTAAAIDRKGHVVAQLERRIELDHERDDIVRRLDEMQSESRYWLQRTVLPWRGVLMMCLVFSAGAMLVLTGLFGGWLRLEDGNRLTMAIIGTSLSLVALVIKGAFERSAEQQADSCEEKIDQLFDRQRQAQEEAAELDRDLTTGSGNLDERLRDAREELAHLQQLMPIGQRLEDLSREADAAEHQATLAVRQLKESRRVWKASLRAVGLPDTLTPSQIGQMTGRVSDVTRLRDRLSQARQELEQRRQELDAIRERIDQLLSLASIDQSSAGLGPQLDRLLAELEKHARSGRKRDELRQQWDELGRRQQRIAATAQQLKVARLELFKDHGVVGISDYRQSRARLDKASRLRQQRDELLESIAQVLGDDFSPQQLHQQLDRQSDQVIQQLNEMDSQHESLAEDLGQMHERSGELKQRLETQRKDRRREKKEFALQLVEEKIRTATSQWLRLAMTSAVLEDVRQDYETKRQPVTLAEASRYLERLTEGRYARIWTPMEQNALCVDDCHARALPVEKLSRGTREQVFLALRLALAGSYRRRGASMPMILDDVFVNFDDERATAAARVLADVAAEGQQMLIFTCHQRIYDIFKQLGGDVRNLPLRDGSAAPLLSSAEVAEPPHPAEIPPAEAPAIIPGPAVAAEDFDRPLPVYDAESWDKTLQRLTLPTIHETPQGPSEYRAYDDADKVEDSYQDDWADAPKIAPRPFRPAPDGSPFQPDWRDRWTPLPDLVAVRDDEDAGMDDFYLDDETS